ncbi:MAG TPA: hydroxymethylbilane synthase [Vicinamibacteria bacterium]|nr:hydroxymethylbilane synthase [Vicinamibacteria bacterium]
MSLHIRIGTRGSALALWQAEHVRGLLVARGHDVTRHEITTTGDKVLDRRLESIGGKGAFLKALEEALLDGQVDLAVHSLKDVPTALPAGLMLCAFLERADPRDVLISNSGKRLATLPAGARVGTSSLRRSSQVKAMRPDLHVDDLRGNVDTRIRRLRERHYDAILLAMAGLVRLGRTGEVTQVLEPEVFVPAPGQGAIALECREDDEAVRAVAATLHHEATGRAVSAERAFLAALEGGCNVPLGAHASAGGGGLRLRAFVARPDGTTLLRAEDGGGDPEALGRRVAADLLARGAWQLVRS